MEVFDVVKLGAPQGGSGAKRRSFGGDLGCRGKGRPAFYPLLISVEARLIFDSQGLALHAMLSDEVASVRQIGRISGRTL
jgi:hypothetical protein